VKKMKKGAIVVDIEKCLGCKSCEIQCAVEHSKSKDLLKALAECPVPQHRVEVEAVDGMVVPLQCRHCEDAPCVKVCPSKALEKTGTDQPVLIDEERCIGCKLCILVCPFGMIKTDKSGKAVIKCDMCIGRLRDGKVPACVTACPTKALEFKSLEEVSKAKRKEYLTTIKKGDKTI